MITITAQIICGLSLAAMAALCLFVIYSRVSRMTPLFHGLGVWFTVPSAGLGLQVVDHFHPLGEALALAMLSTAMFIAGSTVFSWAYVLRRVNTGRQITELDVWVADRSEGRRRIMDAATNYRAQQEVMDAK